MVMKNELTICYFQNILFHIASKITTSAATTSARQAKCLTPSVLSQANSLTTTGEVYTMSVSSPYQTFSTKSISTPSTSTMDAIVQVMESDFLSAMPETSSPSGKPLTKPAISHAARMANESVRAKEANFSSGLETNYYLFSGKPSTTLFSAPTVMMVDASLQVKESHFPKTKPSTKPVTSVPTTVMANASVQVRESHFSSPCQSKALTVSADSHKTVGATQYANTGLAPKASDVSTFRLPELPTPMKGSKIPTPVCSTNQCAIVSSPIFSNVTSLQLGPSVMSCENVLSMATSCESSVFATSSLPTVHDTVKNCSTTNSSGPKVPSKNSPALSGAEKTVVTTSQSLESAYCTASTSTSENACRTVHSSVQTDSHMIHDSVVQEVRPSDSQTEVASSSFVTPSSSVNTVSTSTIVCSTGSTSKCTVSSGVKTVATTSSQTNGLTPSASVTTTSSQPGTESAESSEIISLAVACSKPNGTKNNSSQIKVNETETVLDLTAHRSSTTELGKKACKGKCSCQQQVRTLQLRVRMLRKQVCAFECSSLHIE